MCPDEKSGPDGRDGVLEQLLRTLTPQTLREHYAWKFLVAFLIVVLAIGVVGGLNFVSIQDTVTAEAGEELRSQGNSRALHQSQWVNEMQSQTQLISGTARPFTLSLSDARQRSSSDVVAIHYVNTSQGDVVASTTPGLSGKTLETIDTPWARTFDGVSVMRASNSKVWTTNESYERDGLRVVAFVSPVPGEREAVVVVGSNERFVDQFNSSRRLNTTIYTSTGKHLFGAESEASQINTSALARASRMDQAVLTDNGGNLRVYAPVGGTDWVAVTRAPKSDLYRASSAVGENVLAIIVTSLFLLVAVGTALGRHTIVPLNRLRRRTQQLADNDFDIDLTTNRTDEIGQLYADFSRMRDALQQQIRETREAKEEIESQRDNLQRLNTRLQLALDETDTGVWEWNVDTDELIWDEASERLFGYEPGDFPETFEGFAARVPDDDLAVFEDKADTALETGTEFRADFRACTPGGDQRWIQARGVAENDDDGDTVRILGIQTDITERKEREQELEATKRTLEESNEKLDQFASVVSHDLRNPLNAVQLRLDFLRDEAPQEHVDEMEENLNRMESMIDDLLTLSRAGETVENPQQSSLAVVVRESWDTATTGDAELELEVPETVAVMADRDRLRHVFENLFRNAVDHNEHPLRIRVGMLPERESSDSDAVGFFVEDDGRGIPDDEREDVFEHGYTTSDEGTGFGLSIVQDIVATHGWEVTIVDSEREGARFEITDVEFTN